VQQCEGRAKNKVHNPNFLFYRGIVYRRYFITVKTENHAYFVKLSSIQETIPTIVRAMNHWMQESI
jgi:hypothetical protein